MNKLFFFILLLFLFTGCSKQEEVVAESQQVTPDVLQEAEVESGQVAEQAKVVTGKQGPQRINPFLTQEEEEAQKETGSVIPISYLVLSAVFYSSTASKVIINGQILGVGDSIDNKKIIKIERESAVLKDEQGEYIVQLKKVAGE